MKLDSRREAPHWVVGGVLALAATLVAAAPADVAAMKEAVVYYQGCENLTPTYPGESVHPNPVLEPGRIGKAFRMEQRWALNLVKDPDLKGAPKDAWATVGAPTWLKEGGFASPTCVSVDAANYVRQAVTDLAEGKLCCLSVYARSSEQGAVELAVKSGANEERFQSPPLTETYARFKVACVAGAAVATITLKGADAKKVVIDAVQFENAGRSFPRAFIPQTKQQLGTEWVDIPPALINAMKGAVAFWIKPDWIGEVNAGSVMFASYSKDFSSVAWKDQASLISLGAYSNPKAKDWQNAVNFSMKTKTKQDFGFSVELDNRFKPGEWHHIVVNWEVVPGGDSVLSFFLNGQKAAEKKATVDGLDAATVAYMGYGGGGYADGLMDEFYVFNRPLTDKEAAALYSLKEALK